MNENTRTSMENAIGEIKVSQKTEPFQVIYEKSDCLFSALYIMLGYMYIRFFFYDFWYTNFDWTLPLFTAIYVAVTVAYARSKGKTISKETVFWIGVLAVITALFKIERFFRLVSATLIAAYFTSVTGGMYSGGTSAYIIADLYTTFISKPFINIGNIFVAFFRLFRRKEKREKIAISPAVWGVIMAVMALWFIMPLLFSADANFLKGAKEMAEYLIGLLFGGFDLPVMIIQTLLTLPTAAYMYGLAFGSFNSTAYGKTDKDLLDENRHRLRISPAVTLTVFLSIVCVVYIMFIALQAEYLLGAFTGRLYRDMTYAQYARTGFFELCKVSVINLSLLALCNLVIKKEENTKIKLSMTVLCGLSLLLLSTAMAKMVMYICAYGLTAKRIISTVFLIWLVMVFIMCIARLYKPFNLVKTAVMTGTVIFCILFSFDIGMESHKFNKKYGFEEKAVEKEYYTGLILPEAESVEKIHCTYFSNSEHIEFEIDSPMGIMSMLEKATETNRQSVQDLPVADEYYQLDIICADYDCLTIFIYNDQDYYYAEQPYQAICGCNYDWDEIFSNYYEVTI